MNWDECVNKLRDKDPVASKWVEVVADMAGTTDADWKVFETAGNLLSEFEREAQRMQLKVEQIQEPAKELCRERDEAQAVARRWFASLDDRMVDGKHEVETFPWLAGDREVK